MLTATQQERCERLLAGDGVDDQVQLARHIVATGTPTYRRSWARGLVRPDLASLYPEEVRALDRYHSTMPVERRSATEGGAFGDAVPFDLDAAIIGTSGGLSAPILDVCRLDVLTKGDAWHGVSSPLATGYS